MPTNNHISAKNPAGPNLPVMESFYTLQGEGFHQGKAAYFIRLAGCDVGCVWCDVKESWDATAYPPRSTESIVQNALKYPARLAVITGGEPLLYPLEELTGSLRAQGFHTHLETSGAHPISGQWDWICLSPKKFKAPLPAILGLAHELKIVVFNKSDLKWAEEYAARVSAGCRLYLQPEWSRRDEMANLITEYILENPKWELSLQLHKYIGLP